MWHVSEAYSRWITLHSVRFESEISVIEIKLTVSIDGSGLLDGTLARHATSQLARSWCWLLYIDCALLAEWPEQMLIEIGLNIWVESYGNIACFSGNVLAFIWILFIYIYIRWVTYCLDIRPLGCPRNSNPWWLMYSENRSGCQASRAYHWYNQTWASSSFESWPMVCDCGL